MVAFEDSDASSITCIAIIDGVTMILRNFTNNNNNNNNKNVTKRYYKNDRIIVARKESKEKKTLIFRIFRRTSTSSTILRNTCSFRELTMDRNKPCH